MVLGGSKQLKNDVFCLTEERNYFQSKYLEQISEITSMQSELNSAKREIQKLREEVMTNSVASISLKDEHKEEDASILTRLTLEEPERQQVSSDEEESKKQPASPETQSSAESEEEYEENQVDEKQKLRMDAERLLQWADYRSSVRGSCASSVASPSVPRTIKSTSLVDDESLSQHSQD
jgi:hypothetical protein